jgi:flagellar biosynthesis/type III secretory pathway protein FliH
MKITARIELPKKLTAKIKELKMPLSGGFEEGYNQGYEDGYEEGLAARSYETWTITYVDGTVQEKEVALL